MSDEQSPIRRLTTGSPELDEILGGGIPENSINIIMGEPGSGKTTLAEQLVFANADDDRPMLYLTTLSEPMDKMIRYLQQFRFCDPVKIGDSIRYDGIGATLAANGIGALLPIIKDAIKTLSPKLIVIDSLKAIHDLESSGGHAMRLMLYEIASVLAAYNTTAVFVGEYRHEDIATYPEFAIADGIVELARNALGTRDERYIRVFKLRGSSYRQGFHAFEITPNGMQVYPRLISPIEATSYVRDGSRIPSGVPGFDAMLGGGFPAGSATLLAGPTGSGKTTMAIQFIVEGLRQGENCLLINFQENPTQLAHQIAEIGGTLDDDERDRLGLLYYSVVELPIDRIIVSMFQALRRSPVRRVVIDALGDLAIAAGDPTRMHDYLYALVQHFAVMGVSSLFTLETDPPIMISDATQGRLSHMTDNIVFLDLREHEQVVGRRIRIAKARGISHDLQARDVQIDPRGLRVVTR